MSIENFYYSVEKWKNQKDLPYMVRFLLKDKNQQSEETGNALQATGFLCHNKQQNILGVLLGV